MPHCAGRCPVAHGGVRRFHVVAVVAWCVVASCHGVEEPLALKSVDLGRGADSEGSVTGATRTFEPQSTVYASIETQGTTAGRLHVEWRVRGTPLHTEDVEIHPKGPARHVFHFAPPDGWPKGRAQFVFSLNGGDQHAAAFEVP